MTNPTAAPAVAEAPPSDETRNMSGFYLMSIGGFIISLFGLYYKRKEAPESSPQPAEEQEMKRPVTSCVNTGNGRLWNMD